MKLVKDRAYNWTQRRVRLQESWVRLDSNGFTMQEMMIVVLLIAVVSVAAIPGMIRMYNMYNANGVADQLAADIRYAEQLAITNVNIYNMQLYYDGTTPSSPEVANSYKIYYTLTSTIVVKRVNIGSDAYLISSEFANGLLALQPNGSTTPLNDGRILIGQSNPTTGGHFYTVAIKYSTGKVQVYKDVWPTPY